MLWGSTASLLIPNNEDNHRALISLAEGNKREYITIYSNTAAQDWPPWVSDNITQIPKEVTGLLEAGLNREVSKFAIKIEVTGIPGICSER